MRHALTLIAALIAAPVLGAPPAVNHAMTPGARSPQPNPYVVNHRPTPMPFYGDSGHLRPNAGPQHTMGSGDYRDRPTGAGHPPSVVFQRNPQLGAPTGIGR